MAWPSAGVRTKNWGTEILTDGDLEGQLDLLWGYLNDSLNATTGHGHTGGTSDGPKITLTTGVQGTLPATNGGTGVSSAAQGDILYASAANTWSNLVAGTSGYFLKTQGSSANPIWATLTLPFGSVTTGLSQNSVYQASTDGFIYILYQWSGGTQTATLYIDASNPPTTVRWYAINDTEGNNPRAIFLPIKANQYYKLTGSNSPGALTYEFWPKY